MFTKTKDNFDTFFKFLFIKYKTYLLNTVDDEN